MSDQLLDTIRLVQAEIENNRDVYVNNETQTINDLVQPILMELGWRRSKSNASHFYAQYDKVAGGKVDLALIQNDKPIAFIEAKKINKKLRNDNVAQLYGYCKHKRIRIAVLTNGSEWQFYSPQLRTEKVYDRRRLFTINLEQETAESVANSLQFLHSKNTGKLVDYTKQRCLEKIWDDMSIDKRAKLFSESIIKSLPKSIKVTREDAYEFLRIRLSDIDSHSTPPSKSQPAPKKTERAIVLSGKRIPIKKSNNEVLIQTAEWLIGRGKLRRDNCPIPLGRGERYLVHTRNLHPNGNRFQRSKNLSNRLFLEVSFSTRDLIKHARRLLERYGYPPSTLKLIGFDD